MQPAVRAMVKKKQERFIEIFLREAVVDPFRGLDTILSRQEATKARVLRERRRVEGRRGVVVPRKNAPESTESDEQE